MGNFFIRELGILFLTVWNVGAVALIVSASYLIIDVDIKAALLLAVVTMASMLARESITHWEAAERKS